MLRRSLLFVCFVALLLAVAMFSGSSRPQETAARVNLDELEWLAQAPSLEPIDKRDAPQSIEQLREQIAAVLEREQVPGVGIALVDRERVIWAGGVGVADLDTRRPVDADTQFRAASITKSFVALAVMHLIEQGRLALEQPLHELMPDIEIDNRWASEAPITLAHALEHTAGFDDMHFNEWYGDEAVSPRDALAINPRSRVVRWRPGSRMSYSNPGFTIAGHAIELATGERWDAYIEREILTPLRMPTARFRRTPEHAEQLATGYSRPGQAAVFRPIAHAPAGSLLISAKELGNWVRFWLLRGELDGQRIVSASSLARIERTETLPYLGTDANYGLGNYGDVMHPVRSRGHDGGLPGFLSSYRYFPELGVGYVMLLNATHSSQAYVEIRTLLFAYLTRDRVLPEPPLVEPDPEAIAAAAGYYAFANPRNALTGFIERAVIGLRVRPSPRGIELEPLLGGRIEMLATGDGGFRQPREGGTSVRLTSNADGQRILAAGFGYFEEGSYARARARLLSLQLGITLIQLAVVWALGWALVAGFRRARGRAIAAGALALHGWPALASLCFMAIPVLMIAIMQNEAFATANVLSVGLFLCTLAFAACSAAAAATAVRANMRPTMHWLARVMPTATSAACFAMAIYLAVNDIIGLRVWCW